jgi:hypothetical protein
MVLSSASHLPSRLIADTFIPVSFWYTSVRA